MNDEFTLSADPEEIKQFLHGLGLVPLDEYYTQVKQFVKRQGQSSRVTNEQIQKKLAENGINKDDLSKNLSLLCTRKRTAFSPVITRKRGKAIKKRTPSASIADLPSNSVDENESSTQQIIDTINDDQPLDLRVQTKSSRKS